MRRFDEVYGQLETVFRKDSLARLILQFVLIGVVGQGLAMSLSAIGAKREREAEFLRLGAQARYTFVESFAVRAQRRMYLMSVAIWELTLHNELSDLRQAALEKRYEEYRIELIEWNAWLQYHQIAMSRHFPDSDGPLRVVIENHDMFTNLRDPFTELPAAAEDSVSAAPDVLMPAARYVMPNATLLDLSVLLQVDFQTVHRILKRCADRRLVDGEVPDSTDLAILATARPEMARRVYEYSETLSRLASTMDQE